MGPSSRSSTYQRNPPPPTRAIVIEAIKHIKSGKATDANGLRIDIFKLAIGSPHGADMMTA